MAIPVIVIECKNATKDEAIAIKSSAGLTNNSISLR
jgi:hypothetical protein